MKTNDRQPLIRKYEGSGKWGSVEMRPYKNDSGLYKDVTRQNLFDLENLDCQWRYFEIDPQGHSTLERHEHVHAVMIIRGSGKVLIGDQISQIGMYDLIEIPSMTWHQFQATSRDCLGFLCLVNQNRDRPQLPTTKDIERLNAIPGVASFIKYQEESVG